jgi:hypothetical protein
MEMIEEEETILLTCKEVTGRRRCYLIVTVGLFHYQFLQNRGVYVFLFLFSVKHVGIVGLGFQFDILDCITFLAPRNTHAPSEIINFFLGCDHCSHSVLLAKFYLTQAQHLRSLQ